MAARRADVLAKGLPYLVAENDDGRVIGFAYCQWFKPRPAYRFSAEDSIYLDPAAAGQRIGNKLLSELVEQAEAAGIRKLIAVIGDSATRLPSACTARWDSATWAPSNPAAGSSAAGWTSC